MNIVLDIDEKKIAYLISSGFDGWMTASWCRIVRTKKPRRIRPVTDGTPYTDYPVQDGGSVTCRVVGDDGNLEKQRLLLNRTSIERGLKLMAEQCPHQFAAFVSGQGDAITGDVFLQLAMLGELKYG